MDLSDGTYLDKEICAFSGNNGALWLIVYDGKYNYYLFNCSSNHNQYRYAHKHMPENRAVGVNPSGIPFGSYKHTEYYTKFDNAVRNMCKIVANDGKWIDTAKVLR